MNDESFTKIYHEYASSLLSFIDSYVHNLEDAKDLMQEVFIKLIVIIDQFDPQRAKFKTWLFAVTKNHVLNFLIKRNKILRIEIPICENQSYQVPQQARNLLDYDLKIILDPIEYKIVCLRFYEDFKLCEVAELLEVSKSHVKRKSASAIIKITQYIGKCENEQKKNKDKV